jgi:hypothetical protein
MSDADARLADLWAETQAPSRDLVFELGVEQAIARQRMLIDAATFASVGVVLAGAAIALGPDLVTGARGLVVSLNAAGPVLAAVAAIGAAMVWLSREPEEA